MKILNGFSSVIRVRFYLRNESIQSFYHRNNVPYNPFEKWYKDTRLKAVEVSGRSSPQEMEKIKETVIQ